MKTLIEHTGMYSACWLLFYVCLGILVYILDRQYVQKFWTWTANMGRKEPLKSSRGLVYGQRTGWKCLIATITSTVQSVGLFFFTGFHSNPFVEIMLWFWEIPAMVLGFAIGFWLWPLWEKRKIGYALVDKIDDAIEERLERKGDHQPEPARPQPQAPPAPAEVRKPEPQEDPEKRIARYTRRS